jgi:hypothetical protein
MWQRALFVIVSPGDFVGRRTPIGKFHDRVRSEGKTIRHPAGRVTDFVIGTSCGDDLP